MSCIDVQGEFANSAPPLSEARQALAGAIVEELTSRGSIADTLAAGEQYRKVAADEGFIAVRGWAHSTYGSSAINVPADRLYREGSETTDTLVSDEATKLWENIEGALQEHGVEPQRQSRLERVRSFFQRRRAVPGYDPCHTEHRWLEAVPILTKPEVSANQLGDIGFHATSNSLIFTVEAQKKAARELLNKAA